MSASPVVDRILSLLPGAKPHGFGWVARCPAHEDDTLLYQVVRFLPKSFHQRRHDGRGDWTWKLGDMRCFNLYRPPLMSHGDSTKAMPWIDHVHRIYPPQAEHLISRAIDQLEEAKSQVESAALEPLVYLRADMKVARRLRNLRKGLGT